MMLFSVPRSSYDRAMFNNPELLRHRDKIVDALRRLTEDDASPKLVDPRTGDSVELVSFHESLIDLFLDRLLDSKIRRVALERESDGTRTWFRFPEDTVHITTMKESIHMPLPGIGTKSSSEFVVANSDDLRELHLALTTWVRQPKRRPEPR